MPAARKPAAARPRASTPPATEARARAVRKPATAKDPSRKASAGANKPVAMPADEARLRILRAIRAIPAGQVAGYGEVAARAGLPGRARLVARVLAGNDDPKLPWHRVLRSDGRIAMPEGSRGWREQSQRLRAEGVQVERGRVKRAPPEDRLDAALWGPRGA